MPLHGLHHVTAITADAPRNVDFYAGTLGLRLVKKTVNYDSPDVYHLYYGDERGAPGSIMTFFEFPAAARGRAGAGMVHTVVWRVASEAALEFWAERLSAPLADGTVRARDPEGLAIEIVVADGPALAAIAPDVPAEHALQGIEGVRANAAAPERSAAVLSRLDLGRIFAFEPAPAERGLQGAGTVHHVAWAAGDGDLDAWRGELRAVGAQPTPIIDRTYFRSVYFREPSGVLFELATLAPGFAVDEPPELLGSSLVLPAQQEHLRERLERMLTPVANPRS